MTEERCVIQVAGLANGAASPHDGEWVVECNPDTAAGILEMTTTRDRSRARIFGLAEWWELYRSVSQVEPRRPWDGAPNRPLTGLNYIIDRVKDENL